MQSILPWDFKNYQFKLKQDEETEGIRAKISHSNVGLTISTLVLNSLKIVLWHKYILSINDTIKNISPFPSYKLKKELQVLEL